MNEAQRIQEAIGHVSDRIVELRGEIAGDVERTESIVRAAVADGIRDVLADQEAVAQFWRTALMQVQDHAKREAGGVVFGALKKMATVAMLLILAYSVAGAAGVAKAWAWVTGH